MIIPIILSITCFILGMIFRKSIQGEIKKTKTLMIVFGIIALVTLIIGKVYEPLYSISGLFSYWTGNLK